MIVTVQRTGGFAGLTRSWRVDVEAEPDTESWLVLIDGLPWASTPSSADGGQPDRFVWVIVVEAQPVREAALPEQQLTGPWRELVDRVRTAGSTTAPHAGAGAGSGTGSPAGAADGEGGR
jgi:hypothetical protein